LGVGSGGDMAVEGVLTEWVIGRLSVVGAVVVYGLATRASSCKRSIGPGWCWMRMELIRYSLCL